MLGMNPTSFAEGGGLLDDVDVKLIEVGTRLFDFNGKNAPAPAIYVVFGHGDDYSQITTEHFTVGKTADFVPTTAAGEVFPSAFLKRTRLDETTGQEVEEAELLGMGFDPVSSKTGIHKQSKGGMFLASAVAGGLPEDRLNSGNLHAALQGLIAHVKRQVLPARQNQAANPDPDAPKQNQRPPDVLLIEKVLQLPGAGKATQTAKSPAAAAPKAQTTSGTTPAAPAAAPQTTMAPPAGNAAAVNADLEGELEDLVVTALATAPNNTIRRTGLIPAVYKQIPADRQDLKDYAGQRLVQNDFLTSKSAWKVEGTSIKMG